MRSIRPQSATRLIVRGSGAETPGTPVCAGGKGGRPNLVGPGTTCGFRVGKSALWLPHGASGLKTVPKTTAHTRNMIAACKRAEHARIYWYLDQSRTPDELRLWPLACRRALAVRSAADTLFLLTLCSSWSNMCERNVRFPGRRHSHLRWLRPRTICAQWQLSRDASTAPGAVAGAANSRARATYLLGQLAHADPLFILLY
jgi:hypothetical protein